MMRNGGNTWADHPKQDEYRRMNDGLGACNIGAGLRGWCVLGGMGCDIDHVQIARDNLHGYEVWVGHKYGVGDLR